MANTQNHDTERAGAVGYLELVRQFPLRPIRTDAELDRAIALINSLIDRDDLDQDEDDYLDVLGDLVEKYETEHHPIPPLSDAEMLRSLIASREITQARLAAESGIAESTVSAILSGKRVLNRGHIETLARYFRISPAVFLAGSDPQLTNS